MTAEDTHDGDGEAEGDTHHGEGGDERLPILAAVDRALFPSGEPIYRPQELAARAGVSVEVADRLWRAMGFTSEPDDRVSFREDDLHALRLAAEALARGVPVENIVYQTRVMAAAMARVAEVNSDVLLAEIDQLRAAGFDDEQISQALGTRDVNATDKLLGYFYRRQLEAALWRKLAHPHRADSPELTVGFVDLVRFTAVTEEIADEELSELVDRFELVAHDLVTSRGGRIVKMIGDEVMFVADEPHAGVDIALDLVLRFKQDPSVPPARAGLSHGEVLAHGGDYFGPTVNLAARIVDVARPSTVVTSEPLHALLGERGDFTWRRLPPKRLKGIGRTPLWAVSRSS